VRLISDDILIDSGQQMPIHDAVYPMFNDFNFVDPASWTKGHPFPVYRKMREEAPVMWSKPTKGLSGIWSGTRTLNKPSWPTAFFLLNAAAST